MISFCSDEITNIHRPECLIILVFSLVRQRLEFLILRVLQAVYAKMFCKYTFVYR